MTCPSSDSGIMECAAKASPKAKVHETLSLAFGNSLDPSKSARATLQNRNPNPRSVLNFKKVRCQAPNTRNSSRIPMGGACEQTLDYKDNKDRPDSLRKVLKKWPTCLFPASTPRTSALAEDSKCGH